MKKPSRIIKRNINKSFILILLPLIVLIGCFLFLGFKQQSLTNIVDAENTTTSNENGSDSSKQDDEFAASSSTQESSAKPPESSSPSKSDSQSKSSDTVSKSNSQPKSSGSTTKSSYKIDVPMILQNPELPTGCEVTSLTMVLNHLGYNVTKSEMASKYLKKSTDFYTQDGVNYGPDPKKEFCGTPFSQNAYGCFSPVIASTAEKFLNENPGKKAQVKDITGSTPSTLYNYIKQGTPVIVWATMNMDPMYKGQSWYTESGEFFTFPAREHCLVLTGYDDNNVILNDPLKGITKYSRSLFEKRFAELKSQAVVLTSI